MIISSGSFRADSVGWAQGFYNLFHTIDDRFTMSDGKIRFDDKFSFYGTALTGGTLTLIRTDESSQGVCSTNRWLSSPWADCIFGSSEKSFFLRALRRNYSGEGYFGFYWFKTDDGKDYFGGCGSSPVKIESATFYNTSSDDSQTFSFPATVNYSVLSPSIVYSDKAIMRNVSTEVKFVSEAICSSSVSTESTVTINGKNYFAIGTNILVPITTS